MLILKDKFSNLWHDHKVDFMRWRSLALSLSLSFLSLIHIHMYMHMYSLAFTRMCDFSSKSAKEKNQLQFFPREIIFCSCSVIFKRLYCCYFKTRCPQTRQRQFLIELFRDAKFSVLCQRPTRTIQKF